MGIHTFEIDDQVWDGTGALGLDLHQFLHDRDNDLTDTLANQYGVRFTGYREADEPSPDHTVLREVTILMFQRYIDRINNLPPERMDYEGDKSFAHLRWMCQTSIDNIDNHPMDKLHRWMGYVQCGLFWKDALDVNEERDFSRPHFHRAYIALGLRPPPSKERH